MKREELIKSRERILAKKTWQQAVLSGADWNEPGRTVFECDGRGITFEQYEAASNQIAAALAKRGLQAGKTVALRMKRSERLFEALYGIVKSGAALLPIPEDMPPKRVQDIYDQMTVDLTITEEEYEDLLREPAAGKREFMAAGEDDPALILFTSGSSGKPKGVLHTQRSALYLAVQFLIDTKLVGIDSGEFDAVIAKTAVNFVSTYLFEVPMALFHGKKVIILTKEEQNDDRFIGAKMEENRNALIFLTPSQVDHYLKSETFCRQFRSLGVLVVAGERTSDEVLRRIEDKAAPSLRILNAYGSTECGMVACRDERKAGTRSMQLLPDTSILLADESGQQTAEGAKGELAVSSPHQFRGYVNADARRIQTNGISYYCTGDVCVLESADTFVVKGRKDRMVKYHGLRVELEDIEQNICRFPGIAECAAVINRTEKGTEVLSAYYVSKGGEPIDEKKLRSFLEDYLPVNLIPVGMTQLENLPLNANGKRDNKKLESMIFIPESGKGSEGTPANPEHVKLLCRIVSELTGEEAHPQDNLFQLGMDSLMAFRIISELREKGLSVGIGEIFANPVLSDLAGLLQNEENAEDSETADRYSATGIQIYWGTDVDFNKKTRGLYVTEEFAASAVYTQEEFRERICTLLKRHPALRSHVSLESGMPAQTISPMEKVSISSVKETLSGSAPREGADTFCLVDYKDLRDLRDPAAGEEELCEAQKAYLENFKKELMGCLVNSSEVFAFEAAYFRISEAAGAVILTGNHASIDGTSMNILMEELIARELDDKEDCYRQFLTYIGKKENIAKAIGFYGEYLKGAEFSALPEPEAREGGRPSFKGITLCLGEAGTETLYEESRKEKVSPVGYLMYTYGMGLLETLEKDALIMQILTFGRGIPVSGMDRAVGCFIEYVPVVIRREDTVSSFQNGSLLAEQNSFAPLPVIWKQLYGLEKPPKLAPFLISEVFPEIASDGYFCKLSELDYEKMFMGNFIARKDGAISVYFHFDVTKTEEKAFYKVADVMCRRLKDHDMLENCRIG